MVFNNGRDRPGYHPLGGGSHEVIRTSVKRYSERLVDGVRAPEYLFSPGPPCKERDGIQGTGTQGMVVLGAAGQGQSDPTQNRETGSQGAGWEEAERGQEMRVVLVVLALAGAALASGCLPKTGGCPNCRAR